MEVISPDPMDWDATRQPQPDALEARSYADVSRVMDRRFCDFPRMPAPPGPSPFKGFWVQPEQDHFRLEQPTAPFYRPKAVEDRVFGIIHEEVDRAIGLIVAGDEGHFDFAGTLGEVPWRVIARDMGMQPDNPHIKIWLDNLNRPQPNPTPEEAAEMQAIERQVIDTFREAQQRLEGEFQEGMQPKNAVESLLVAKRAGRLVLEGESDDDTELSQWEMLFVAGGGTTDTTMGNGMHGLAVHGVLPRLRDNPQLTPNATEEALRKYHPFGVLGFPGVAKIDFFIGDGRLLVEEGAMVTAFLGPANHDYRVFRNPYGFERQRPRSENPHLAFAPKRSWRYCTGQYMARAIIQTTVNAAVARLPGLQWDGQPSFRTPGLFLRSIPTGGLGFVFDLKQAKALAIA